MPILNYTTTISPEKTVMEIQMILARAGAKTISIDYDEIGAPVAVSFFVEIAGNWVNFRLPSNYAGVQSVIEKDPRVPTKFKTQAQARRVSWRITKDWTESQMAIVEAHQAELAEVFLPYAVMGDGQTLFKKFQTGRLLLGDGEV